MQLSDSAAEDYYLTKVAQTELYSHYVLGPLNDVTIGHMNLPVMLLYNARQFCSAYTFGILWQAWARFELKCFHSYQHPLH